MNHYVQVYDRATNTQEELVGPFDERQAFKVMGSMLHQINQDDYGARIVPEDQLTAPHCR